MILTLQQALTYDDITLKPKYSNIVSRKHVDLSTTLGTNNNGALLSDGSKIVFSTPIISAPMDTVTESKMVAAMSSVGGLGIVHRYNTIEQQVAICKSISIADRFNWGAAIGVTGDYLERAAALLEIDADARIICIDVAHAHHKLVKDAITALRDKFGSDVHIMAGNVATSSGYAALANWGADSVKVGIGSGSICSTRLKTGHGVPNISAIAACDEARGWYGRDKAPTIIADGGIRKGGDIVKALAFGADFVMCGSLLAGTDETPNDIIEIEGKKYKSYRGMASSEAQESWRGFSTTPEGIATTIPAKGPAAHVLKELRGNIQGGLSYSGARNIEEFKECAEALVQTSASTQEALTHILS